jgi:hypothetical protein
VLALAPAGRGEEPAKADPFAEDLLRYRSFFDYGGFTPDLGSILPTGYGSRWTVTAGVDGTYTDNVDKTPDSSSALWSDGVLGVGWLRRSPRLEGSLDYRYSAPIYKSDAVQERNLTSHTGAAALRWQAAERLSLSASGSAAQNFVGGFQTPVYGVRSSYENRSDQYDARLDGSWKPSAAVAATGGYSYSYRNFVAGDAEGDDTLTSRASAGVTVQASPRDTANVGYAYEFQEDFGAPQRRGSHSARAGWDHLLVGASGRRLGTVTLAYRLQRELSDLQEDYWSHAVDLGYGKDLSAHTHAAVRGGYEWSEAQGGETDRSWIGGADAEHRFSEQTTLSLGVDRSLQFVPEQSRFVDSWSYRASLDHRFSAYTSGRLGVSQGWEYRPATSRTDFSVLTETRRASGSLASQWGLRTKAGIEASYESGTRDGGGSAASSVGDYWDAGGAATIDSGLAREGFWGAKLEVHRRQNAQSDDDYLLEIASLLYRREVLTWLTGTLRYSHERRDYDAPSTLGSYHENQVIASLTAAW